MEERSFNRGRRIGLVVGLLFALSVASISLPTPVTGATTVCGHLTGVNVWAASAGPFYMTCDVEVDQGRALKSRPGSWSL